MAKSRHLYEILDVEPDAEPRQIISQYRVLARKYHPDKNPGDSEAANKFLRVKDAYDILSDAVKRKHYDKTGIAPGSDLDLSPEEYQSVLTPEDIEEYEKTYKGSADETEDLKLMLKNANGSILRLFEYIPFSEPGDDDFVYYTSLADKLMAKKGAEQIGDPLVYAKSKSQLKKKLPSLVRAFKKDRNRHSKRAREDLESTADSTSVSDMKSLTLAIQNRQQKRAQEGSKFLDSLAERYGSEDAPPAAKRSRTKLKTGK